MATTSIDVREFMREKFFTLTNDEKISRRIEKGAYNFSIEKAENNKILKKWSNSLFRQIYINKCRSLYANLKKGF